LEIVITQSVTYQQSYPTDPYAGKFCMPSRSANSTLRDEIINGPYAWRYRGGAAFGSLRRAAPLLIAVALLSVILGYFYLFILSYFAGLLIFVVMLLSVLLIFASGLFFLWAIFIPGDDEQSVYHAANPIFRTYIGWEAKWSSIVIGLLLVGTSWCLGFVMCRTYDNIDEAVGVVQASCECLSQEGSLRFLPLVQSVGIIALIAVFLVIGLPWVASLGYFEKADISINEKTVDGLFFMYRRSLLDKFCVLYYLFGCWWVAEFYISFGQFVVSYAVCLWYFQEVTEEENALPAAFKQGLPIKQVKVRVSGVDDYYMPRDGLVMKTGEYKYLIVPVDDEDEDFGPDKLEEVEYVKKPVACAVTKGICVGFWNHMGSLALGCLLIALCRPFRMFSECLGGFVRKMTEDDDDDDDDDGDKGTYDKMMAFCSCDCDSWITLFNYLGICFDTIFGGYTKNTYTEIVLSASEFQEAAEQSLEFFTSAGGSAKYLQGACFVFEVYGTLCITVISTVTFVVLATKLDTFSNQASPWYIPNLYWGTLFAILISLMTSFEFMQIFNHTADTLLYAFAWNRTLSASVPELKPGKFCPGGLRDMMQEFEMDPVEGLEMEGEYTATDYVLRAGFEYPLKKYLRHTTRSSGAFSSMIGSSRWWGSESDTSYGLSRIEEERMGPGSDSARELSFR